MGKDWGDCLVGKEQVAQISCIFPLFQNILAWALSLAGTVAIFFILYAGVKLILSGGDAKKIGSARQTLVYAILGLVIIFISFLIISFISYSTGVKCITTFGFGNCK